MLKIPSLIKSNSMKLISGTAITQLLSILFTPLITRFFSPAVFGQVGVFLSIIAILGSIACLRLEYAIVIPGSEEEAQSVFSVACFIAFVFSLFLFFVLLFFNKQLFDVLGISDLRPTWFFLPALLLLTGLNSSFNFLFSRWEKYSYLSISRIITALSFPLLSLLFAIITKPDAFARIVSNLLSLILAVFFLTIKSHANIKFSYLHLTNNRMKSVFSKFRSFVTFDVVANLINSLSWQLVPILFMVFFTEEISGFYSLSLRMIQLPMSMVGAAISQVFFVNASKSVESGTLVKHLSSLLKRLVLVGFVPTLLIAFFSPFLFSFFFGEVWRESGVYSQLLSPWAFIWFIANPIGMIIVTLKKQRISLLIQVLNLFTRFLSLYLGYILSSVYYALIFFSISGFFLYSSVIIISFYIAYKNDALYLIRTK